MSPPVTTRVDGPRVLVLGPLEVETGGSARAVTSASQRAVLATLALAPRQVVSTDRLVDVLWGDRPPPSAINSLQSHVARLRRTLEDPSLVVARPPGYVLDLAPEQVDAVRFERLVDTAGGLDDPAEVADLLQQALGLWRSDALPEHQDGPLRDAATRLDRLRLRAVADLADALLALGRHEDAVRALERVPGTTHDERSTLRWMQALAAAGRTVEADAVYQRHRTALAEDLGLDPSPDAERLHVALLRGELAPTPEAPASSPTRPRRGAVPVPRSSFVGRDVELTELRGLVAASRLVTVVGPGGVGKTRLVAECVRDHAGAVWVDLAPATDAAGVVSALTVAVGRPTPRAAASVDELLDALVGAPPDLVVLDNVEQVAPIVTTVIEAVLEALPAVTVVATSRERLGVGGEDVLVLAPLDVDGDEATAPAVRLLLDRAEAAIDADDPAQRRAAAEVVAALDGLPLAIELAAGQARNLGLAALRARLDDRLDLLDTDRPIGRPAHRGLRALIRWSTDLLEDEQARVLARLAAFGGTFTLELAEAVVAGPQVPAVRVAPALSSLVDRSLVVAERPGRFRLLGLVRAAALEWLSDEERSAVRRRHASAVVAEAERHDRRLLGREEADAVESLHGLGADLRLAHHTALEHGDTAILLRLAAALHRYAYLGLRQDLLAWGEDALLALDAEPDAAASVAPEVVAVATVAAAASAVGAGDLARAGRLVERALPSATGVAAAVVHEQTGDLCLTSGDAAGALAAYDRMVAAARAAGAAHHEAGAWFGIALVHAYTGAHEPGRAALEEVERLATVLGSPSLVAWVEYTRGELAADRDPPAALEALERAAELAATVDSHLITGVAKTAASAVRARHGDPCEALERFAEALEHWRHRSNRTLQATTLRNVMVLLARVGADEAAAVLYGAVDPEGLYEAERRRIAQARAAVTERLGEDRAVALGRRGAGLCAEALLDTASAAIDAALADLRAP